jgi:hypothetical protein
METNNLCPTEAIISLRAYLFIAFDLFFTAYSIQGNLKFRKLKINFMSRRNKDRKQRIDQENSQR